MAKTSGLLDAIKSATAEDLSAIQERIKELQNELDSLRSAEKLLSIRLNGKPERKRPGPRAKAKAAGTAGNAGAAGTSGSPRAAKPFTGDEKLRDRIFECITVNGPGTAQQIALKLRVSPQAVEEVVSQSDWFTVLDSGKIIIATTGGRKGGDLD
jgi:predicted PP-loop superfamily ATPase